MEAALILLALAGAGMALAWARERMARRRDAEMGRRELAEQRTRREAELREQAQRTAALFDRMVEGLIVLDSEGRIRLANRAAAMLFGFEAPAAGRTVLEATRHHDIAAVVSRLERELEVLDHELRIESMDAPRFIQVNALALRDSEGASDGAILVFHAADIWAEAAASSDGPHPGSWPLPGFRFHPAPAFANTPASRRGMPP